MSKSKRSNIWAFVGYPGDSLPSDFLTIINNWHIPCLISPIHDSDKNADDTEKKEHIHFMLYFGIGANKSFEQVKYYTDQLNATIPIIVNSVNAMIRYFIHADNPEKHQYNRSELLCLNGFEIKDAFDTYDNERQIYEKIESTIAEYRIYNFSILVKILKDLNYNFELDFLRKHTLYFRELLNGNYQLYIKDIDNVD